MKDSSLLTRFMALLFLLLVAAVMPAMARADTVGAVTLNGYGGVDQEVYTSENSALYAAFGNFNQGRDIYISIYPNGATWERWDIYLVPPLGPLAPGTYENAGSFGDWPSRPALVVQHF